MFASIAMPIQHTPDSLLPHYRTLLGSLCRALGEPIGPLLKARRTVGRHGTCSSLLFWTVWDRRQNEATLPPGFFAYSLNFDPDHFETDRTSWILKLHMNTVRIYHNGVDVRAFLLRNMEPACPKGFHWRVHPREIRVEWPFEFDGPAEELPAFLLRPFVRLVESTHPVLDRLLRAFGQPLSAAERAEFIQGRSVPHAKAARGADVVDRGAYRHGIPARLREQVLARYGHNCAICGRPLDPGGEVHIDHVASFAQGGLTVLENLRPSHARCNLTKGSGKVLPPELRAPAKRRVGWKAKRWA